MSVFKIINYAYDAEQLRIIVLVDDGKENLQLYTGDTSHLSPDASELLINWSRLTYATFIKSSKLKEEGFTVGMRYVNNTLYIKDVINKRIEVWPNVGNNERISLEDFRDSLAQEKNEKENFYVSSGILNRMELYYGAKDGLYHNSSGIWQNIYPTSGYPTIIKANKDIVVMVVHDNRDSIFISHKNQGLTGKWEGHNLKTSGQVFDVLFNDDLKTCFLITETNASTPKTEINLFYYEMIGNNLQITWGDSLNVPGFTTEFNGQASGDFVSSLPATINRTAIGTFKYIRGGDSAFTWFEVDNRGKVGDLQSYKIQLGDDTIKTNLAKFTSPTPYISIYLHSNGELYIAPGGFVTNNFIKVKTDTVD